MAAVVEQNCSIHICQSQKYKGDKLANPMVLIMGTEGQIVAQTTSIMNTGIDGLSTASATLTVCLALLLRLQFQLRAMPVIRLFLPRLQQGLVGQS